MRPGRLLTLLMVALTAGGCVHGRAPQVAEIPQPVRAAPPDLDALAYGRPVPSPAQVHAHANANVHAGQPPRQARAPINAASDAEIMNRMHMQAPQPAKVATSLPVPGPVVAPKAVAAPVRAVATVPVAAPVVAVAPPEPAYTLDTGDKLRIVVFGQDGLSNSYFVDAAGQVTLPLIGPVRARGLTTQQLAGSIAAKLRAGYIREPHVAIEVEIYRPFFILGEVTQPGQYPYVPNMTVETAVAIAGGYSPRAYRWDVKIDRPEGGVMRSRNSVPLLTRVRPGDTIIIKERWF